MATIPTSVPVPLTFTAVTAAADAITTVGKLTFYDYGPQLVALDTEITAIGTAMAAMATEIGLISAELAKLQAFLIAVQSPTGDFRTVSPEDIASSAVVSAALAKNVPPIVPTGGITS